MRDDGAFVIYEGAGNFCSEKGRKTMKKLMFAVALMQAIGLAARDLPSYYDTPFNQSAWKHGEVYEHLASNAFCEAGIVYRGDLWQRGRGQSCFFGKGLSGKTCYQYDEQGRLVSLCEFGDTEKGRAVTNRLERERLKACDRLASEFNMTRQEMEAKYEEIHKRELAELEKMLNGPKSFAELGKKRPKKMNGPQSFDGHSHDDEEEFVGESSKRDQYGLLDSDWRGSPWCTVLNNDLRKYLDIQSNELERCGCVIADSEERETPSWFRTSGKNLIDKKANDMCCKFDCSGRLTYAGHFGFTEEAQHVRAAWEAFVASNRLEWAKERGMTVDEAEKGYKAYVKRKHGIEVRRRRGCGCLTYIHLDPEFDCERKFKTSRDRQERSKAEGMPVDRWEWESGPWAQGSANMGVEFLVALSNVCERFNVAYVGPVIDMNLMFQDIVAVSNFCQKAGGLLRYARGVSWTNRCGRSLLVSEANRDGGMYGHETVCRYDSEGCLVWRGCLKQTEEWQALVGEWREQMSKVKLAWAKKYGLTTAMCDWISAVGYDKWVFESKTDEFVDETNDVNSVFGVCFMDNSSGNYSRSESLRWPVKWFDSTPMAGVREGGFQTLEFNGRLPMDMAQAEIDRNVAKLKKLLTAKWETLEFVENKGVLFRCEKPLAACITIKDGRGGVVKDVKLTIVKNDRFAKEGLHPYECLVQLATGSTLRLVVDDMKVGEDGSFEYYLDGKCRLSFPERLFGGYMFVNFVDDEKKSSPIRVEPRGILEDLSCGSIQLATP